MVVSRGTGKEVIRHLLIRLGSGGVTLCVVLALAFLLLHLAPGDPLGLADDPRISPEDRARLREAWGLDRPLHEQFGSFFGRALSGDLGVSLRFGKPVAQVLGNAMGPSLLLAGSALLLAWTFGLFLGTLAVLRPRGMAGFLVHRLLPCLDALPPFWLGLLAIWLFSWKLGWLPSSHMTAAGADLEWADLAARLVLPVLTIALPGAAPFARHHAAALARELTSPHVTTARALGLPSWRITILHAGRVALLPSLTLLGLALPTLAGGTAVVEVVFAWPGLGRVQQEALLARDLPLAMGGLLLSGALVIAGGFIAEGLATLADPRWRGTPGSPR